MKRRNGFITNSSSSSFIIIGKKVRLQDIDLSTGKKYIAIGKEMCEGEDVFEITQAILDLLPFIDYDFSLCEAELELYDSEDTTVELSLNGVYKLWSGMADYHNTTNADDLVENYEFDKNKLVKLLRKDKIDLDTFLRLSGYEDAE